MRCQHCSTRPASKPRDLCRTCWQDKSVRLSYPLKQSAPHYGRNPGIRAGLPDYITGDLTLDEMVGAVFLYWNAWDRDYDAERALRCDLTAIYLRKFGDAERATVAVSRVVDARREVG